VPSVNLTPASLVRVNTAGPPQPGRPGFLARVRLVRTELRLALTDAIALGGAVAALLPLLPRRRPLGRLPMEVRRTGERPGGRQRLVP